MEPAITHLIDSSLLFDQMEYMSVNCLIFINIVDPPTYKAAPTTRDPLIRPYFTCTEIVKSYLIVPLKSSHPSY
jgi:hypothetical protein